VTGLNDMRRLIGDFRPKFAKRFRSLGEATPVDIAKYAQEVQALEAK